MSPLPRLVMLMGSGETAPTMIKPHRAVFERMADSGGPAVILDTPYGFQENASDISARAVGYFRDSVGAVVQVAGLGRVRGADPLAKEAAMAKVAGASWLFAGPGSPTYALSEWRGTELPGLLADKAAHGGCLAFASAAALTLGAWTVPVYEIYKVGSEPAWLEGLDVMGLLGMPVAVIPHYDNAEGGGHDTRFCYLGERRLRLLEEMLPEDAWILGIDEHTACLLDLDAGEASVMGNGVVTIRRRGRSSMLETGATVPIQALCEMAAGATTRPGLPQAGAGGAPAGAGFVPRPDATPLAAEIRRLESEFGTAIDQRDLQAAVRSALELEEALSAWTADTNQSDDAERGRAALRRMIVRLGEAAVAGLRDPREVLGPFVDALLLERSAARSDGRYADADRIREALVAAGVEVRDTPEGTRWVLDGS